LSKNKKIYLILLLSYLLLLVFLRFFAKQNQSPRFLSQETTKEILNQKASDKNITLYVSNQSFAISPVDIVIKIDNEKIVDSIFHVDDQHNWYKYTVDLKPGIHKIEAFSTKGIASLTKSFNVTDRHWIGVDFWYYPETHYSPTPRKFSFFMTDKRTPYMH